MNSNRHALRSTENRLPLQDVSSQKYSSIDSINQIKSSRNPLSQQQQQENLLSKTKNPTARPILTALRTIKQNSKENDTCTDMLVSPLVKTSAFLEEKISIAKTREQLEEDLFELPDYRQSIFEHLKSVEPQYAPKKNFMEQQSDINTAMRTILIDWLIEVSDEYKLNDDTLFLSVQYVDRFLSTVNVTRSKLQLLGTTCAYIAAKYEEMYPPALEEFSFITDNTYETKHILRMEQIVMKMLNFSLSGPTSYTFLQHYLTHLKPLNQTDEYKSLSLLAKYLCTSTLLQDHPFSIYRPSLIAASCLLYAFRLLNPKLSNDQHWSDEHVQLTTYTQSDMKDCLQALADIHLKTYEQDKISSSLLRRYLKSKKDNCQLFEKHVRELIHHSTNQDDDDEDEILDLTLDEYEEDNNMSLDLHR